MSAYSIFKINGDLFKAYDADQDDWRIVTPHGERWFSKHKHKHLSLEESFISVFNRLVDEYKIDRYNLDMEFIK